LVLCSELCGKEVEGKAERIISNHPLVANQLLKKWWWGKGSGMGQLI